MPAQRSSTSRSPMPDPAASGEDLEGFGVGVIREEGKWRCVPLSARSLTSLRAAETELRELRSSGAVFGLIDVDDEFLVVLRPAPSGTRLLVSDAAAALDYDIAADVLEALHVEVPDLDPDELYDMDPWAEGDLAMLADLDLPEPVLAVILSETDLYPDEQMGMIAQRMGFAGELTAVLDKLLR